MEPCWLTLGDWAFGPRGRTRLAVTPAKQTSPALNRRWLHPNSLRGKHENTQFVINEPHSERHQGKQHQDSQGNEKGWKRLREFPEIQHFPAAHKGSAGPIPLSAVTRRGQATRGGGRRSWLGIDKLLFQILPYAPSDN